MKIGAPSAVYSGKITKTEKNDPTGKPAAVPDGLAAVPADHWFQITEGEVLVGQFADAEKRDVLVFATHNPYEPQKVSLSIAGGVKVAEFFDRKSGKWVELKFADKVTTFTVEEAAVELVRFQR